MLSLVKVIFLGVVVSIWALRLPSIQGALRWFFVQMVLSLFVETICMVLIETGRQTTDVYNVYSPFEFLLFILFGHLALNHTWSWWFGATAILIYAALLGMEYNEDDGADILFSRSLVFGWGYLTVVFTYLLILMARDHAEPIWKAPLFWVYLSVVLFFGVALPFVGLMNHIYRTDQDLAVDLMVILDVLYFMSYGCVGIAGWIRLRALSR